MSTQRALTSGNQFGSNNGQEREQTWQANATGNRIDEPGTGQSMSPEQSAHHGSCCCLSCWQKKMRSFL
jgi:hypothetical protein